MRVRFLRQGKEFVCGPYDLVRVCHDELRVAQNSKVELVLAQYTTDGGWHDIYGEVWSDFLVETWQG